MAVSIGGAVKSRNASVREVRVDPPGLDGLLGMPAGATGIVACTARGGASSRLRPRDNRVADAPRRAGLATLLIDLLPPAEAADRNNVFEIDLLAGRLLVATEPSALDTVIGLAQGWFVTHLGGAAA